MNQAQYSSVTPNGPARRSGRRLAQLVAVMVTLGSVALGAIAFTRDGKTGTSARTAPISGTVWVANESGGSLTAIDAGTNQVSTTVAGIEGPHNVQVAPDGQAVWAVSGHDAKAVMIDSKSLRAHGFMATGSAPAHVVVSPDGRTTYTSNGADGSVSLIDVATMKTVGSIPVGAGPHGLRPSPDGRWVYVANVAGTTLSVIDTVARRKVADVEVGKAPAQVAFSPDGRFVYTSLSGEAAVAKVDVTTRRLVGKIGVGDVPIQTFVSPDGRYLLVANQGTEDRPGTTVSVIGTDRFALVANVETGMGAHGVVVDPSSRYAYVTNIYGDDVAVLDLSGLRVVARVPVGDKPNGISFSTVQTRQQPPVVIESPEIAGVEPGSDGSDADHEDGSGKPTTSEAHAGHG